MQIKGANTILKERCEFYGEDLPWLFRKINEGCDEPDNVMRAMKVYQSHIKDQEYWIQNYGDQRWKTRA